MYSLTHIAVVRDFCLTGLLVRYMLLTVSSFKSVSVHNPYYLSPTVLEHTLTV